MQHILADFYLGDEVRIIGERAGTKWYAAMTVNRFFGAGRQMSISENPGGTGVVTDIRVDQVRLERRGNFFRHLFGMDLLPFPDLSDEATFWFTIGELKELRNPADDCYYTWTREQALEALEAGDAVGFFYSSGGPGLPNEVLFGGYAFTGEMRDHPAAERLREGSIGELKQYSELFV